MNCQQENHKNSPKKVLEHLSQKNLTRLSQAFYEFNSF